MKQFLVPSIIYDAFAIEHNRYNSHPSESDLQFFEGASYRRDRFYGNEVKCTPERLSLAKRIGLEHLNKLRHQHAPHAAKEATPLGDPHYEWMFIPSLLSAEHSGAFICAGAGINISFELLLAKRYTYAHVYILDPSPQSLTHFKDFPFPPNVSFVPIGLANTNGCIKFYKPSVPGVGSLSAVQLNPGEDYFMLPVTTLSSFCATHDIAPADVHLLKFDIEGAEHSVIDDLLATQLRPQQVMCEFDQPCPPWTIDDSIRKMLVSGYSVASIWGANVLFVQQHNRNH
jgi:FkbM family methyltransferase